MGLFGLGKKKQAKTDLDHLTSDGELPVGWYYANKDFTKKIETDYHFFLDAYSNARSCGVTRRYQALKSLVVFMEHTAELCKSKGECFAEWSTILVANPDIMASYSSELQYLEDNMDELLQKEKMLSGLKEELKKIIAEEPGVIQSDLYKRYDKALKGSISNELYQMEAHNVIIREKSGRSYKLFLK